MENLNLIREAAWSFHKTTGIDWEELFSEGCLAWVRAEKEQQCIKWREKTEENSGSKTTWLFIAVRNQLADFCRSEAKQNNIRTSSLSYEPSPFHSLAFKELFEGSEELKTVYKLIVEAPENFAGLPPKLARGEVYRKLREMGWPWSKIWDCFRETKSILNETA